MVKVIKSFLTNMIILLYKYIQDILIISGFIIFIIAMFKFISQFWGYISLSIVLIILGLVISKSKN